MMNNELEDYIVQDPYHPTEKEKLAIEELTNKGLVPGDWNSQKAGITEFKDHIVNICTMSRIAGVLIVG